MIKRYDVNVFNGDLEESLEGLLVNYKDCEILQKRIAELEKRLSDLGWEAEARRLMDEERDLQVWK